MTDRKWALIIPLVVPSLWAAPLERAIIKVAREVRPALVQIQVQGTPHFPFQTDPTPFEFEFDLDCFFRQFRKYFRRKFRTERTGSGFIFRREGNRYYILTSAHVVRDACTIKLKLHDGTFFSGDEVEVLGTDRATDVAVLRITTEKDLKVLKTGDSDRLEIGQWVVAAGNPMGYGESLSAGIISALGRSSVPLSDGPSYQGFIQFDATVGPGSSGGPLLDLEGRVIGMVTALSSTPAASGFGFAIPINTALWAAEDLIQEGRVVRGYLGVRVQDLTPELAEGLGLQETKGALITEVLPGTPAEEAGLQEGDVILEVNGQGVKDADALRLLIARSRPGKAVDLRILRDGKMRAVKATLAEYPEEETATIPRHCQNWGLEVEQTNKGVEITEVEEGSPADEAGLQEGDLIRRIGRREIKTLSDFRKAVEVYKETKNPVVIVVERNGHRRYFALRP